MISSIDASVRMRHSLCILDSRKKAGVLVLVQNQFYRLLVGGVRHLQCGCEEFAVSKDGDTLGERLEVASDGICLSLHRVFVKEGSGHMTRSLKCLGLIGDMECDPRVAEVDPHLLRLVVSRSTHHPLARKLQYIQHRNQHLRRE